MRGYRTKVRSTGANVQYVADVSILLFVAFMPNVSTADAAALSAVPRRRAVDRVAHRIGERVHLRP